MSKSSSFGARRVGWLPTFMYLYIINKNNMKKAILKHGLTAAKYAAIATTAGIFVIASGKSFANWEYYAFLCTFMASLILYSISNRSHNTAQNSAKEIIKELRVELRQQSQKGQLDLRTTQ